MTPEQQAKDKITAALELIRLYYEVIDDMTKHSTLKGIPSGELFAVIGGCMSLETHMLVVQKLKDLGMVVEINHLLSSVAMPKAKT